jgi:phage shock protein A
MHDIMYKAQQDITIADRYWVDSSSRETLDALLAETDQQLGELSGAWAQLLSQLHMVESAIAESDQHARRLDAFVDDALYSGDADTARRCAEQARMLRHELAHIVDGFRNNKQIAASVNDELAALMSKLRAQ